LFRYGRTGLFLLPVCTIFAATEGEELELPYRPRRERFRQRLPANIRTETARREENCL